jgi:hypothetical protein
VETIALLWLGASRETGAKQPRNGLKRLIGTQTCDIDPIMEKPGKNSLDRV